MDKEKSSKTECETEPARERIVRTSDDSRKREHRDSDGFWDLGKPTPRVYEKPEFSDASLSTTSIENVADHPSNSPILPEKITERASNYGKNRIVNTINGSRISIGSYNRHSHRKGTDRGSFGGAPVRSESILCETYDKSEDKTTDPLIHRIDVRRREPSAEFYSRFRSDAFRSHRTPCPGPDRDSWQIAQFFSFIPQYAHMSRAQLESYYRIRECIRNEKYPQCDLSYLQLYIFEIINLPDEIPPSEGVRILANIWLAYRVQHPRLDGYLCEWLPDYCMLHDLPMPEVLFPIVPEVTPKSQFKEFFFNGVLPKRLDIAASTLIETVSDYDYRTSRYYADNKNVYDKMIPAAVAAVIEQAIASERGVFAGEKIYKITRESYSGAIISSEIKRTLEIEFSSFTRQAASRQTVTSWVKYSENMVRRIVGVKAKLGVNAPLTADAAIIEKFFMPHIPVGARSVPKEDEYMPRDYAKLYEAEKTGFDFDEALLIETSSWANTSRLTGESYDEAEQAEQVEQAERLEETPAHENDEPEKTEVKTEASLEREGLSYALEGEFSIFCRGKNIFEGDLADKINTLFLDVIGDVVLVAGNEGYELIEDYREDVEAWLNQTK